MSNNALILFFSLLMIGAISCKSKKMKQDQNQAETRIEVPFNIVPTQGQAYSGNEMPQFFTVNSTEEIRRITELTGIIDLDLNSINFKNEFLIVVTAGMKTNGGFQLQIDSVKTNSKEIFVYTTEIGPGTNCMVTDVIAYPFQIAVVKKEYKRETLVQKRNLVVKNCN